MRVLKNFPSWDIFWSGGIETFSSVGHILVWGIEKFWSWDIVWSEGIKNLCLQECWNILSPKFIEILNYIKSLCIIFYAKLIFVLNFETFWSKKSEKKIHTQFFIQKCFNTPVLYTTNAHFYNPSVKIGSISFLSSSDRQNLHHLLGCHATGIGSYLIFF